MPKLRRYRQHTKIVCTVGPASSSTAIVERMIKAGMNVARFNLAHGSHSEHVASISRVRKAARHLGTTVAILLDIPGPKYRVAPLKNGSIVLKPGKLVTLTTRPGDGDDSLIPVTIPRLPGDIRPGDAIVIDDGAMELRVQDVGPNEIKCRVLFGGLLTSGRAVVFPASNVSPPFLTDELRAHLAFAIEQRPDFIALSFVSGPDDVSQARAALKQTGAEIPIIAKIERRQAVTNFDRILAASDGIMVARGDLGVNIPLQKVPLVQKETIAKCNRSGKPVITATQMLLSMVDLPRPTRAEVTDVANAIFDGSDAVMLSNETSVGKYPVQAVRTMAQIVRETERKLPYDRWLAERQTWVETQTDELISYNACYTAARLHAKAIVAFTHSGSTARRVCKYRPRMPVVAITSSAIVYNRLLLSWGVQPVLIQESPPLEELFATAATLVKNIGLAKPGELLVITGGIPVGIAGTTNLLKVERIK